MAAEILKRDQNFVTVLAGVTNDSDQDVTMLRVDPITKRLLVSASASGIGTVTSVSVVTANGFAGTVATATTTPAITLSTTVTGLLKGNGTAISAAVAGTDYVIPGAITSSGLTPPGSDTYVIFNDGGAWGTDSHFTYDKVNDVLHAHKLAGDATDGLIIESANGTDIGILGPANTANVTWYGSHNFDTVTASRVAQFGASKTLESSTVTTTELGYLSGVTSAIQTQINSKFTLPSLTSGSVLFSDGSTISQDNSNFFWDNTNKQLKIGSTSSANATTTNPLTVTKTSTSYVAVHIQNLSSGTAASSDLIIANNNDDGTVSTGKYLDAGINGDGYTGSGILNGAGDAYIYNNLEDLIIATGTAGKNVIIGTGGFSGTAASKTRATFTDTGLQMMNGTAAAPSISFTGSTTTGFYRKTTDSIGFAIAGTERAYITSGGIWNFLPSSGGTVELGSTSQFMDFAGTVIPSAATSQLMRTNMIWTPDVARTSIFSLNNNNIIGGSNTGLTLTNLIANRSANTITNSIGITVTNAYNYDAPATTNSSSGTVSVTNEVAYRAPNFTVATNSYGFYSEQASGTGRWGVYINGSARNYMNGGLSIGTTDTASGKVHIMTGQVTGSVNVPILVLQSTATNDDVVVTRMLNRATTTSGTAASLGTITTANDYAYRVETNITARRTGGTAGTAGDYATYKVTCSANNIGGTLTIGAVTTVTEYESQAGWNATIDVNGVDLRVRVTGAADNNITWHAETKWMLLST